MDPMQQPRCPGNDMSTWKPDAIAFITCPACGGEVEIWKDEPMRLCPACKAPVRNPALAPNCEKWCSLSDKCPGVVERKNDGQPKAPSAEPDKE